MSFAAALQGMHCHNTPGEPQSLRLGDVKCFSRVTLTEAIEPGPRDSCAPLQMCSDGQKGPERAPYGSYILRNEGQSLSLILRERKKEPLWKSEARVDGKPADTETWQP